MESTKISRSHFSKQLPRGDITVNVTSRNGLQVNTSGRRRNDVAGTPTAYREHAKIFPMIFIYKQASFPVSFECKKETSCRL